MKKLVCQVIRADTTNGFFLSANLYFIASKLWGICWDGEEKDTEERCGEWRENQQFSQLSAFVLFSHKKGVRRNLGISPMSCKVISVVLNPHPNILILVNYGFGVCLWQHLSEFHTSL